MTTRYLDSSYASRITHAGTVHVGRRCVPCTGTGHILYVLPLTAEEVAELQRAPWSRPHGGRKSIQLRPSGDEIFVSANPACRWPGTSLRPRTDKKGDAADAGPVPLDPRYVDEATGAPAEPQVVDGPMRYLGTVQRRWLVQRILEIVRADEPGFESLRRRLIDDLLRRWTSDGLSANGLVVVEGIYTSFDHLPHTQAARAAEEERGFVHEHVVPCRELREWLLAPNGRSRSEDEVEAMLVRHCIAALVHESENELLPKSSMPPGWIVAADSDPWARYKATSLADGRSLFEALTFPEGYASHG